MYINIISYKLIIYKLDGKERAERKSIICKSDNKMQNVIILENIID